MQQSLFQTSDYVDYLRQHCRPGDRADKGRVPGTEFIERVLTEMDLRPGAHVLEVGCGIGRVMQLIEGVWGAIPSGCDVSEPAIAEAKLLLPEYASRLFVSSAERIPTLDQFDNVIFWGVFEMTEQRLSLVEVSRLLKIGGTAMLCSVKSSRYRIDDEDSKAAHRAYIEKQFPITYTDIAEFETLLQFLGFTVTKRLVFHLKSDIAAHRFSVLNGSQPPPEACSDIYYVVEKQKRTPLDNQIQFTPQDLSSK